MLDIFIAMEFSQKKQFKGEKSLFGLMPSEVAVHAHWALAPEAVRERTVLEQSCIHHGRKEGEEQV